MDSFVGKVGIVSEFKGCDKPGHIFSGEVVCIGHVGSVFVGSC